MDMEKILNVFIGITFVALLVLLANIFITSLPDWTVRAAGITTLVSYVATSFVFVRIRMKGHEK